MEGRRLVGKLKLEGWLAAQDRTTDAHIWIGRPLDWNGDGTCVFKRVTDRTEQIGTRSFTRDDVAVAVEWWEADPDDSTHYEKWVPTAADIAAEAIQTTSQASGYFFIVNSTELRGVGVDSQVQDRSADTFRMQPIVHQPPVVIQHTRAYAAAAASRAVQRAKSFRLLAADLDGLLARCWCPR